MRGRLLLPFYAEVFRLDTYATAADPDGAGPLLSGVDPDFREPIKLPAGAGEGPGTTRRVEKAAVRLPCQVEVGTAEKRQMFFNGNSPDSRLILVFHMKDLERLGFVDAYGRVGIHNEDRLGAIYDKRGVLVRSFAPPQAVPLYASQVEPAEYGLGSRQNLLVAYFDERETGVGA